MSTKSYIDLTGLGHYHSQSIVTQISTSAYYVKCGNTEVAVAGVTYYVKSGDTYTAADPQPTIGTSVKNYYILHAASSGSNVSSPSVNAVEDFVEAQILEISDDFIQDIAYDTMNHKFMKTKAGTTTDITVADDTEGGTYQSKNLITSGAVNAGLASVSASIKDSTITIKKNDGSVIDSFTLNQSSNKDITLPELGKVDDIQVRGTTIVSNKIANFTNSTIVDALGFNPIDSALKGANNGVAELDSSGKVPSAQLPSYVDDVIEGYYHEGNFYSDAEHTQLITPESGKVYVDLHTNKTYRWSGSTYVIIGSDLALGETSSTAYRGDRGKAAYDASVVNVDNTEGGTYQSTNLITSGAVNAGLAAVNANIKDSTITLTQNDDTVIDSFTLNQSTNKTIKLPELGKVDDVQINGTTIVSNKIANITKAGLGISNVEDKSSATIRSEITSSNITTALGFTPMDSALKGANNGVAELDANGKVPSAQLDIDNTDGGTYQSTKVITSGAVNAGLAAVNSGIADVKAITHTTAEWESTYASLVLKSGQLGIESSDPIKIKIGDGVKTWTQLPYFTGATGAVAQEYATTITSETAPTGSTIYTIPGYTATSYVEVFMNNLRAVKGVQYTITSAGAVTSLMDLGVGTNVIITCYTPASTSTIPVTDVQVNGTTVVVDTVANITGVASLDSPALTGTPTAPTATAGTSTTQIATTEFVMLAIQTAIQNAMSASY